MYEIALYLLCFSAAGSPFYVPVSGQQAPTRGREFHAFSQWSPACSVSSELNRGQPLPPVPQVNHIAQHLLLSNGAHVLVGCQRLPPLTMPVKHQSWEHRNHSCPVAAAWYHKQDQQNFPANSATEMKSNTVILAPYCTGFSFSFMD